ncbi:hypothetical protein CXB51_009005 [Gossypium anomalum]|uniref:DUF4219 domain-containing protein n=1 Tax=Gossypium anomalum TaxID=47600 RepID=A0A8J5ZRJ2_9ROSI|nr:hypothetical protein CXB51_009005 [Gossypium anomalum]
MAVVILVMRGVKHWPAMQHIASKSASRPAVEQNRMQQLAWDHFVPFVSMMSFTPPPPPVFAGENYHIWVVKMKTYLQAQDLWSVVENDIEPPPLRANPPIAQIRQHTEENTKKHKALACL